LKESRELIEIVQKKADLEDLNNLKVEVDGIDASSEEKGVAVMHCGHKIGRDTMVFYVESQLK
jgi:hypothetical protein